MFPEQPHINASEAAANKFLELGEQLEVYYCVSPFNGAWRKRRKKSWVVAVKAQAFIFWEGGEEEPVFLYLLWTRPPVYIHGIIFNPHSDKWSVTSFIPQLGKQAWKGKASIAQGVVSGCVGIQIRLCLPPNPTIFLPISWSKMVENLVWVLAIAGIYMWDPKPTSTLLPSLVQLTTPVDIERKWKSLSCVQLFATPWTVACQGPLSMEFSTQEYWST